MKKAFVITISLLMAVSTFGQSIKVTPALKKGMEKTYNKTASTTAMGQTVNITSEQKYTVTKETSEGYEMTLVTTNLKSDGNNENLVSRLALLGEEVMKDSKIQLRLDKEGKVLGIINFDEVKVKSVVTAKQLIDELFGAAPELAQLMKREQLEEQIIAELTPELMTKSLTLSTSPLTLFGRTIVSGMEEKYNNNMVNLKRIWLVTGKRLGASAKTDMSREELKDYILKQVEKTAPQQAAMIKDNIDTVLDSGLLKLDVSEKSSYELADDLWVKSMETTVENDMRGQKSTTNGKVQLKD